MRQNTEIIPQLKPWTYEFTWKYQYADFFLQFKKEPKQTIEKISILEWWSSYDIDSQLSKKWLISPWEYRDYVVGVDNLSNLALDYPFLSIRKKDSLEWFLYPDTYFLNPNQSVVPQLVKMQLDAFNKKVWLLHTLGFDNLSKKLKNDWMELTISPYSVLILASIVEREERSISQKPLVAWIFMNRLNQGMRIDADITVCYWLKTILDQCNPSFVVENITQEAEWYNTRVVKWLPPTPISNPSTETIWSVLNYIRSDYLFYLHDSSWIIHYWKTIQDHEKNKNTYIK